MVETTSSPENLIHAATREHLLEAAGKVFSEVGFRTATVRQICERAGANIAAVNYHFGDKEALYRAVLKASHEAALAKFPFKDANSELHPAPKRLNLFISSLLSKIFSEGPTAVHGKLMVREMIEPTGALKDVVREDIRPMSEELNKIVIELMGEKVDQPTVRLCCMSVVSQVLFYHHCRPAITHLFPDMELSENAIEKLAGHITRFSLAGMKDCSRKETKP